MDRKKKYAIELSEEQLELMNDVFHFYKDFHRETKHQILSVMELECAITDGTNGDYISDTTYNVKPDWDEFHAKWNGVDRSALSISKHREFVSDFYHAAETNPRRKTFLSNCEKTAVHNGKGFRIAGRTIKYPYDCDPLDIPCWKVIFEDGTEIDAEAEEILETDKAS